ncbi:Gal-2,6-Sulfurylases II [Chondrus crispus]|uniref:Gal-2,6-Sulfurylases II n=1 Tax=Chondrus crispus TaxID=2769 RepID=R7Q9E1_CHOCR|nr:Gal-2,6-Sulfurylases II [Chondrus crispus]CDF35157.1 Gal-2,6-Sulfurylases II [Chondrus crispus]|eukprot:XP_005714976.1 Gal-2,6-Sulfurylases II [Chondrus crispus]
MFKLFVVVFLFATATWTVNAQCGRKCRFRICPLNGSDPPDVRPKGARIRLRGPDTSRTGYICRSFPNNRTLGTVERTGTATVSKDGITSRIDQYRPPPPPTLSPMFPKNYFRLYNILYGGGLQGIGRRASSGNQEDFLDDLCVTLPIRRYNIENTDGSVFRTISTNNERDCVSFRTINQAILVEVAWDSADDFDLSVQDPDGGGGRLIKDNNIGRCQGGPPQGKEAVVFDTAKPGTYEITLRHFNNCGGRTRFTVNAIVNGVRVFQRRGRSSVDGKIVLEASFEV